MNIFEQISPEVAQHIAKLKNRITVLDKANETYRSVARKRLERVRALEFLLDGYDSRWREKVSR